MPLQTDKKTGLSFGGSKPLPTFINTVVKRGILLPLWRVTRGMTLGVRAIVFDDQDRVLLVRHGYTTGAHFPGGGVDRGETVLQALHRELEEEAKVRATGNAQFHGVFSNFVSLPGDHVFVYVIRGVEHTGDFVPNREITSCEFYPLDALPEDLSGGTSRRLAEVMGDTPIAETW